jgi:hypothetical protein
MPDPDVQDGSNFMGVKRSVEGESDAANYLAAEG